MKAALHEHLQTSSKLDDFSFNYAINLAKERLGLECAFGVIDFNDKRYHSFINLLGYEREFIGEDKRALRVLNLLDNLNIIVVHGEEVPTRQGHVLVMGLGSEQHLKHNRTIEDTIKEAKDLNHNAVIIADHPFYIEGLGPYLREKRELIHEFDALELNGEASFGIPKSPLPYGSNKETLEFYMEIKNNFPNLGLISSQDGHSFYEFCRGWTDLEKPDLSSAENFSKTFRKAVQNTNESTPSYLSNYIGMIGAIEHICGLIWILKIAPKIGLGRFYEVERPDNK